LRKYTSAGRRYKEAKKRPGLRKSAESAAAKNEMVWFLLGAIYERQKFFAKRGAVQESSCRESEKTLRCSIIRLYARDLGIRLDEAEALVQKALKEDPYNGAYLDSLGWIYFKENKLTASETTLRKAVERERHDATIHSHLGDLYAKMGRSELAAAEWESRWENGGARCPRTWKPTRSPNSRKSSRNRSIACGKNPPPASRSRN